MLKAEDKVIDDGNKSENDFRNIETILDWQPSACHWENPSKEIKNDIKDRPSFGTFSLTIPNSRRSVLYKRDD